MRAGSQRHDRDAVAVQVLSPRPGDDAGANGAAWIVDLKITHPSVAAAGFAGPQLTGPGVHANAAPFGRNDHLPGLVVLSFTTTSSVTGFSGPGTNLANLFNVTAVTDQNSRTTQIQDTWIVGAPIVGQNLDTVLTVAVVGDLNHDGIYNDAPAVITDVNHDGRIDARDLRAMGCGRRHPDCPVPPQRSTVLTPRPNAGTAACIAVPAFRSPAAYDPSPRRTAIQVNGWVPPFGVMCTVLPVWIGSKPGPNVASSESGEYLATESPEQCVGPSEANVAITAAPPGRNSLVHAVASVLHSYRPKVLTGVPVGGVTSSPLGQLPRMIRRSVVTAPAANVAVMPKPDTDPPAGVMTAEVSGYVDFALPYLREYLREHEASDLQIRR